MTNKALTTLGIVAALLMAGGQQVAAQISACPIPATPIGVIEATPGFSCTISSAFGTATISHFSFSPLLTDTTDIVWGFRSFPNFIANPPAPGIGFEVVLQSPYPIGFPDGSVPNIFDYQLSISNISNLVRPPGLDFAILDNAAFSRVAPATGAVTDTMSLVGNVVGSIDTTVTVTPASTPLRSPVLALNGDTTLTVSNSAFTAPGTNLRNVSLGNAFGGAEVTFGTPEPMSLSLFGVGLAGLALASRRRGSPRSAPPT